MKRKRPIRMLAGLAAAAFVLLPTAVIAGEFVVVDSSVPGMKVGTTLASGTPMSVPDKGRVVLLASNGQMLKVNGPFHGMPLADQGDKSSRPTDAYEAVKVLFQGNGTRMEAGVMRGPHKKAGIAPAADGAWRRDHAATLDNVLAIDATDGGDACLYDPGHAAVLHNPSHTGTMTIHATDNDASATIEWTKGTATVPWPASLPIIDGAAFRFEESDHHSSVYATVHLLPPPPAAAPAVERVAQFVHAGCRDQAKLMLALVAKEAK